MNNVIKTGFNELDSLLNGGIKQNSLNLICSKSGMGKTTFALNIINSNANNKSIAYFNFELSQNKVFKKMNKLFNTDYSNKNIFVYEYDYNKTIEDIINKCIELKKSNTGLDLVVIDYIDLIQCEINTVRKKEFNSYILNKLYVLAQEYGISIIAVGLLQRTNKEITINDLCLDETTLNNLENIFYLHNNCKDNNVDIEIFKNNNNLPIKTNINLKLF